MRLIDGDALIDTLYEHEFSSYIDKGAVSTLINDEPAVDVIPITFERFRFVCKFFKVGCNEDRQIEITCRRKDMIPEGCSWGICDKEHCPYMKGEEG